MIKSIIFDFDGVILDTVDLKGDSFVELFSDYDQKTKDQIYNFHNQNLGKDRIYKIEYILTNILKTNISDSIVNILNIAIKYTSLI